MATPRTWPRSFLLALTVVYVPVGVPFVVGPLTECSHCVATYLRLAPIVPGVALGVLVTRSDLLFWVLSGGATLALLTGSLCAARHLHAGGLLVLAALLMPLLALEAHGLSLLLRA